MDDVNEFMKSDLRLPALLLDEENVVKMCMILFQNRTKKILDISQNKSIMLKIFKENSIKIRKEFFKDPLIKSLWGRIYTSEN